jgi:hypothetical protein
LALVGTRIKAVNNKDRNFTRGSLEKFIAAADERLDDYLRRLDAGDPPSIATALLDRLLHHAIVFQIDGSTIASASAPTYCRNTFGQMRSSSEI